jgi:regulator of protease activity HflC (stomatin/prohibitin superfamily)
MSRRPIDINIPRIPRPRLQGRSFWKLAIVGIVVIGGLVWLGGATFKSVPVDKIGLHYTGGLFQGQHFEGVIAPGTNTKYYGEFDRIYLLPSTQRTYIVSKDPEAGEQKGADFISAPSSDSVPFTFEAAVYFKLNPKPEVLRHFFEQICLHDNCYDLAPGGGWDKMLAQYFRPQIENALRIEVERYDRDHLYRDPDTLQDIQKAIGPVLTERINAVLGGPFFCGPDATAASCPTFAFVLKNPTPPDNVVKSYSENAASAQDILTSQNQAKARVAAAQGEADAQRARASAPSLTADQIDYIRAQAMQACASNANCTLVITDGGAAGTNINVGEKKG